MNSRIKELAPGLNTEAIATDIHLRYDPTTGHATADFHFQDFIVKADDDTVLPFASGQYDTIIVPLQALVERVFLKGITGLDLYACLKQAADQVHNERPAGGVPGVPYYAGG